jgi:hypothetical protein
MFFKYVRAATRSALTPYSTRIVSALAGHFPSGPSQSRRHIYHIPPSAGRRPVLVEHQIVHGAQFRQLLVQFIRLRRRRRRCRCCGNRRSRLRRVKHQVDTDAKVDAACRALSHLLPRIWAQRPLIFACPLTPLHKVRDEGLVNNVSRACVTDILVPAYRYVR